jgi:hypothetical protein
MSGVSLTAQVWSCAHPKINGENAARAQSARTFDPSLNTVSHIVRPANDPYSGRPSVLSAANGTNGLYGLGYAGLNPSSWMALETGLRQVEFQANMPNTKFYDTMDGANRAAWPSQKAGSSGGSCAMYNGPDAYTSTPYQSNQHGQTLTQPDYQKYMSALYQEYRKGNPYY